MKKLVMCGTAIKGGKFRTKILKDALPQEKTIEVVNPGEYSIDAFKSMYPIRYQNLVDSGMPFFVNGKITVK